MENTRRCQFLTETLKKALKRGAGEHLKNIQTLIMLTESYVRACVGSSMNAPTKTINQIMKWPTLKQS